MSIELRKNRRIAGTVIIGLLFLFLVFALVKTQLIDADQYKAAADSLAVSTSSVKASRGEILDCNGKPLVTNRQGNSVVFKYSDFPSSKKQNERNDLIFSLINLFEKNDIEWRDPLPLKYKKGKLIIDKEKETEFEYMVSEGTQFPPFKNIFLPLTDNANSFSSSFIGSVQSSNVLIPKVSWI